MSMLKEEFKIRVRDNIPDMMDAIKLLDLNDTVFASCINENHEAIEGLLKSTKKLGKRLSKTRFGMAVMLVAGIVYAVRNEKEKDDMRNAIINIDKKRRGITQLESEGEALEPMV